MIYIVDRFEPALVRMYKTNLKAYSISFVTISHKTKKFFILNLDFRPIVHMGAI